MDFVGVVDFAEVAVAASENPTTVGLADESCEGEL